MSHFKAYLYRFIFIYIFFQNPREADAMTKINADLDETKIILVRRYLLAVPHSGPFWDSLYISQNKHSCHGVHIKPDKKKFSAFSVFPVKT